MKREKSIPHCAQTLLCWFLLAGLIITPPVTAADFQRLAVEQRYAVVPPPSPARTPAEGPQAVSVMRQTATKVMLAQTIEDATHAVAQESTTVQANTTAQESADAQMDFLKAIRTALDTSPRFKATQFDIEISKLGEKDLWYKMFPKINLNVSIDKPLNQMDKTPPPRSYINVGFNTGSYDPISAYIGHEASKVAISLAKTMHSLAIEDLMEKVGISFVKLNSYQRYIECRKDLAELAQKLAEYAGQRTDRGSMAPLDKRVVELKSSVARMELMQEINRRTQEIIKLKRLLGLAVEQKFEFDVPGSLPQIVGEQANYTMPEFSQVEKQHIGLKAMKLSEKLQANKVRLAMAEHLPKFSIGLRTPDPTATNDTSAPYYLTFGATMPLWAWGETTRNVERDRFGVQKLVANNSLKIAEMHETWDTAAIDINMLKEQVNIAKTMRELRELEATRKSIAQQAGTITYESLIEAKATAINAKISEIKAQDEYYVARVKIRTQSGELFNEHIRVNHGHME